MERRVVARVHGLQRDPHERGLDDGLVGKGPVKVDGVEVHESIPERYVRRGRLLCLHRNDTAHGLGGVERLAPQQQLVRRYLEGFGPATIQDIAAFSTIYRPPVKEAVEALGDALACVEGPNGEQLFDVPGGLLPPEDTPAPPRLMAMWDNILLGYVDRSLMIPPHYRQHVNRKNGDILPTLLVDGYVAGVWRPVEDGIEATAFHRLSDEVWAGLEAEARGLAAFLWGREPMVYRRYAHWWSTLSSVEVRVLRG